ncbi:zinc finger protein 37 [Melampsora americana]|nr:zinc finger protein 37 [Melampsora americana]
MEFKNQSTSTSSSSSTSSTSTSSSNHQITSSSHHHSLWDQFLTTTNPNSSTFDCCSNLDQQQLFNRFCCSNELCLPLSDLQSCDQTDCNEDLIQFQSSIKSTSLSPDSHKSNLQNLQTEPNNLTQIDSSTSDCFCCDYGCPPSPILKNHCLDCLPSSTTDLNSHQSNFQSPSSLSIQNLIDSVPSTSHSIPQTPIINSSDSLSEEIVWINKELEELIRCCCCEEPTPCENLPTHHADAHPSHHVSFDLLGTSQTPQQSTITSCQTSAENAPNYPQQHSIPAMIIPTRPPALLHVCQWKDCNSTFTSQQELINHVNSLHLFTTSHLSNHSSHPPQYQPDLDSALLPSLCCSHPSAPPQSFSDQMKHLFATGSFPSLDHFCCPDSANQIRDSSTLKSQGTHGAIQPRPHSSSSNPNSSFNAQEMFNTLTRTNDTLPSTPSLAFTTPTPCSIIQTSDPAEQPSRMIQDQANSSATKLYPCNWKSCKGHTYLTTAQLTEHISSDHIGSGKSSYTCLWEGCPGNGKSFNQRQKVMRHLQSHTGDRPFECEVCEKRFGEMATLVQHRRTHTNEKPYTCTYEGCNKSFALQSALTIHKRTHTGDKPFKCTIEGCKASFSESSNLSKHLKTHSGLKNFECQVCKKKFGRSDQLFRHMNVHDQKLKKRAGEVKEKDVVVKKRK